MISATAEKRPFLRMDERDFDALGLHEGDAVELLVLRRGMSAKPLSREEKLALLAKTRGVWADDPKIAEAFDYLERQWAEWQHELTQS